MNRRQRRATAASQSKNGLSSPALPPPSRPFNSAQIAEAVALHRSGRLSEAEALYRGLIARDGDQADTLHLLAVVLNQTGRQAEAMGLVMRALALQMDQPLFLHTLANSFVGLKRWPEAVAHYRRALALMPTLTEALNGLGVALLGMGETEAAIVALERSIALRPEDADAHYNLGNALGRLDKLDIAATSYATALRLRPTYAEAWGNLGNLLQRHGDLVKAEACYRRALSVRPGFAHAEANLGGVLTKLNRVDDAIALLEQATLKAGSLPEAHSNYGVALDMAGRLDDAMAAFERAIRMKPDYAEAYSNRGVMLLRLRRLDAAIHDFHAAIAQDPTYVKAHFHLAMALMMKGQFAEGLAEYEWRWRVRDSGSNRIETNQPEWNGEPLKGRTILLYSEQGFGDTLQFCRFAPLVAGLGGRVILRVQPPLVRLLTSLAGITQVIGTDAPLPAFDLKASLMSCPRIFGMTLNTIPAATFYLAPRPDLVARWQARLATLTGLKVGLVWAGDPRPHLREAHMVDLRRSLPLAQLAPLAGIGGVTFVSLQKGAAARQLATPPVGFAITDWMEEITDFADTAALIAGLDLVISVDTSVAHLAGALGKPVWIMSRYDACWRWLEDREDSPWYPTLRLFRQDQSGDWAGLIARVATALGEHLRVSALPHPDAASANSSSTDH